MEKINIINEPLFDSILEIKDINYHIDIHNDYNFKSVVYESVTNVFKVLLNSESNSNVNVEIVFEDVSLITLDILLKDTTIDNFYRGRYEYKDNLFEEFEGRKCFYIDFDEGSKINLLCKKAFISFR